MADHMVVMKDSEEGVSGEKAALMIYDEGTDWCELVGVPTKSANHAELALRTFMGDEKVKAFYSDNSKELKAAARKLAWVRATATPYRPESNGKIERLLRLLIEGIRAVLASCGLPHKWWPIAAAHFAMCLNLTKGRVIGEDRSSWERRHNSQFPGLIIPFGAEIQFRPTKPNLEKIPKIR